MSDLEKEAIKLSVDLSRDKMKKLDDKMEDIRLLVMNNLIQIEKLSKQIGYDLGNITNFGITIHNKFSELTQIFKKRGLLFRPSLEEKYDYTEPSFIGNIIEEELAGYFFDAYVAYAEFNACLAEISRAKLKKSEEIENSIFIKRVYLKLKNGVYENGSDFSVTDEERKKLDDALKKYTDLNKKIFNYEIDENIIKLIIGKLLIYEHDGILSPNKNSRYSSYEFLKTQVIPELESLGYPSFAQKLEVMWILLKKSNDEKLSKQIDDILDETSKTTTKKSRNKS